MTYQVTKPPPGIQINRNHPLAQGLVACWLFNEGSGLRVNDITGNGNSGALVNFEPFSSTQGWSGTNRGTGLLFNGTNNTINCGNNASLSIVDSFTIESWVNVKTTNTTYVLFFAPNFGLQINNIGGTATPGSLGCILPGFVAECITNNNIITTNTWFQMVYTKLPTVQHMYLNGSDMPLATNLQWTANLTGTHTIGSRAGGSQFLSGFISHVRIWNRVLNQTEVQSLYGQPFSMFNTTIVRR